jgi:hypothetical protein
MKRLMAIIIAMAVFQANTYSQQRQDTIPGGKYILISSFQDASARYRNEFFDVNTVSKTLKELNVYIKYLDDFIEDIKNRPLNKDLFINNIYDPEPYILF